MTADAIAEAIQEFDALGREGFLAKYGYGKARGFFLVAESGEYDSKAILGAAHGFARPDLGPLDPNEFSGGDQGAAKRLRELGFTIEERSTGAAPAAWWVNQGATYPQERDGGYLWAPLRTKAGHSVAHHADVARLRLDDVVVHYANSAIRAISVITGEPTVQQRPVELPSAPWESEGHHVTAKYFELPDPIRLDEVPDRVPESGPFAVGGNVKQVYLVALPGAFARQLRSTFAARWPIGSPWGSADIGHWLFQSNPKYWDLSAYLATATEGDSTTFAVNQYRQDLAVDDLVVLWQAGSDAGAYALAQLIGEPREEPTPEWSTKDQATTWMVPLRLTRILDQPIARRDLLVHPALQDLEVIRFANATNFKVTPQHWQALMALIDSQAARGLHLLLKWSSQAEVRTIDRHKNIAESAGSVWWGKFGRGVPERRVNDFQEQIASGVATHVYLLGGGTLWRADLLEITTDANVVPDTLIPNYYDKSDCGFFLRLTNFVELTSEPIDELLVMDSNPVHGSVSQAVRGQSTTLYVRERGPMTTVTDTGTSTPSDQMEWLERATLWDPDRLLELIAALTDKTPQVVLAGPPGTGKTWVARHVARFLTGETGPDAATRVRTVQFHPTYGYEEFVEGLRPALHDRGGIQFERTNGVILELVETMKDGASRALVIDEMNRANLPRVFGELMFLLEYRDEPLDLLYTRGFSLPRELYMIGTMNTADRSIRSVDVALRRRFDFFETPPSAHILRRYYDDDHPNTNHLGSGLYSGFEQLNGDLTEAIDRHHTIGHTFFMAENFGSEQLALVWRHQLAPLIEEYFFDQPDVAATFGLEKYWPDAT